MNSISTDQNGDRQLQRLAAQRQLYTTAKTILAWHVVAGAPVTVALAFTALFLPDIKSYAALWGVALVMS